MVTGHCTTERIGEQRATSSPLSTVIFLSLYRHISRTFEYPLPSPTRKLIVAYCCCVISPKQKMLLQFDAPAIAYGEV